MTRSSDLMSSQPVKPDLYTGETPVESAHKTWRKVQKDLAYALGPNVHRSWTGRLHISAADEFHVTLTAPTRFIASKIDSNYADHITRFWQKHDMVAPPRKITIGKPKIFSSSTDTQAKPVGRATLCKSYKDASHKEVDLNADSSKNTGSGKKTGNLKGGNPSQFDTPSKYSLKNSLTEPASRNLSISRQQRYTFDEFVIGSSNEFAAAAARQIASFNSMEYNPVVFYGENGMGKTHLIYAIDNAVKAGDVPRRVMKVSGEEFVSTFLSSLSGTGRKAIDEFKARLRGVDLLMIDDAHFIINKKSSQEELLHTMDALIGSGRQVLLTMDRHPDEIETMAPRLKSFLSSGLSCKIGLADFELRQRILDKLINRRRQSGHPNLAIPKPARDLLAARINATPRDLEGAFNQVVAHSDFLGTPITLEYVQEALAESGYKSTTRLTVDHIQRVVAKAFEISLDDMASKRRSRAVARPRQVAMYLCKKMTQRSLPDIGRRFGGRDHTTVMHAVKRITELRASDEILDRKVTHIEQDLKS